MSKFVRCVVFISATAVALAGCSRGGDSVPASPEAPSAGGTLRVEARVDGFHPSAVSVPPDTPAVLEFVRTAEKTCITAVVLPGSGEKHELPLNVPVRVTVTVKAGEAVPFGCPMDMYTGTIRAAGPVSEVADPEHKHAEVGDPKEIAYWTCSMHPSVKSETPGTCPICSMDLTPVTRGELETGVILVDAQRRQLIGVTTEALARRVMTQELRIPGEVVVDETRVREVTLRTEAWIERVEADFHGKHVRKGDPLLTYFSPELFELQSEYLVVAKDAGRGPAARTGAESRLRLRGMEAAQIETLLQRGQALEHLQVTAPITGTVLEKNVVAGTHSEAGTPLYRIADLSTVWVEGHAYATELAQLTAGARAKIAVQGISGRDFEGTVAYVHPDVDEATRTGRVRFEVANEDGSLRPGQFAEVRIALALGERLAAPESAVIRAGETEVMFVDLGEGRLEPRRVTTSVRAGGYVEILEGVKEGETVVTSANFLIAAESKLKSGLEKW